MECFRQILIELMKNKCLLLKSGTGTLPKRTGFGTRTLWILGTETSPKSLFKLIVRPEPLFKLI